MPCPERDRLLEQFAVVARVHKDAVTAWHAADESDDLRDYRALDAARQTTRIDYEIARLELEKHTERHRCSPKN
jgi:hypothetical protein